MKKIDNSNLTRREFLIALGGAVGVAVVGWIAVPKVRDLLSGAANPSPFPELLNCLNLKDSSDGTEIYDISEPGNPTLVCKVNQVGGSILHLLNGRNSLTEIIQGMSRSLAVQPANPELFASRVALFISRLAEAGFIRQPFYVNLVEHTVVS